MGIIKYFNERVKRFSIFDIKLVQGAAIFFALIIIKLVPDLLNVSIWWFVALSILCAVRPMYLLCRK